MSIHLFQLNNLSLILLYYIPIQTLLRGKGYNLHYFQSPLAWHQIFLPLRFGWVHNFKKERSQRSLTNFSDRVIPCPISVFSIWCLTPRSPANLERSGKFVRLKRIVRAFSHKKAEFSRCDHLIWNTYSLAFHKYVDHDH